MAEEVGGGDKEVVREYFNNTGFQRWKKIYGDTDEVNWVQRDIRLGHAKTVENTLSMLKDEGSLQGVTIFRCWRAERFSSSGTMLPTSSLSDRARYWRCCQVPYSGGIWSEKKLSSR
ncbi:hypothetical protein JHK84_044798 [Glycine max]|nr:hypothetical protein JHK86_044688 [Glycine max]KAG4951430.1 hypothetical protein JHK85_045297 [Glycine max]KAG5107891.1 hypothetical protein JHK84_044798 [Glycine max]